MSPIQIAIWFIIGAGAAVAGYSALRELPERDWPRPAETAVTAPAQQPAPAKADPAPPDAAERPAFDIVRIDPDGVSVLAGRAAPNSLVILFANGRPVATARTQDDGGWSIATEHRFETGEIKLSLMAKADEAAAPVAGQVLQMKVAAGKPPATSSPVLSATRALASLPGPVTDADRPGASGAAPATGAARTIPLPIKFNYGEATMTSEGWRAAVQLADYIRRQGLDTVTLSGHADERGSDRYNMDLSRQRLETIARFLRDDGFKGKLVLEPKGKREPFTGIDRESLPAEERFQLDRRVEIHLIQ